MTVPAAQAGEGGWRGEPVGLESAAAHGGFGPGDLVAGRRAADAWVRVAAVAGMTGHRRRRSGSMAAMSLATAA